MNTYSALKIYLQDYKASAKNFNTFEALEEWAKHTAMVCPAKITIFCFENDETGATIQKWAIESGQEELKVIE